LVNFRMERLNRELLRLLSEMLEFEVKDEVAREAVLLSVDCSPDLSSALVYFTLLDEEDAPRVEEALERVSTFLRRELGKRMRIRTVPRLNFKYGRRSALGSSDL